MSLPNQEYIIYYFYVENWQLPQVLWQSSEFRAVPCC